MPLMQALKERKSGREFGPEKAAAPGVVGSACGRPGASTGQDGKTDGSLGE